MCDFAGHLAAVRQRLVGRVLTAERVRFGVEEDEVRLMPDDYPAKLMGIE